MKVCIGVVVCLAVLLNRAVAVTRENKVFVPVTKDFFDFDSSEDILRNERYARHVEVVTETVIAHILKELKTRYPDFDKQMPKSKLKRIAKTIEQKLQKMKQENKRRSKQAMKTKRKKIVHYKNKSVVS